MASHAPAPFDPRRPCAAFWVGRHVGVPRPWPGRVSPNLDMRLAGDRRLPVPAQPKAGRRHRRGGGQPARDDQPGRDACIRACGLDRVGPSRPRLPRPCVRLDDGRARGVPAQGHRVATGCAVGHRHRRPVRGVGLERPPGRLGDPGRAQPSRLVADGQRLRAEVVDTFNATNRPERSPDPSATARAGQAGTAEDDLARLACLDPQDPATVASQVRCKSRGRRLRFMMLRGGCSRFDDHLLCDVFVRCSEQLVA